MSTCIQGSCLCSSVKFKTDLVKTEISVCHCVVCRKQNSGPFFAVAVEPDIYFVSGQEKVTEYPSSSWATRMFCSQCGSLLGCKTKDNQQVYLNVALLESEAINSLALTTEIFYDQKPGYYEFANHTTRLTKEEVLKLYTN